MGKRLRKLKKIRLHREGTHTLLWGGLLLLMVNLLVFYLFPGVVSYVVFAVSLTVYLVVVNFFRCPIRIFDGDTERIIVAPADGRVVVVEEVEENEYFHDRRLMVSIFMSLFNVHANWIPVDGIVRHVTHFDGNYHRAWLPKASIENEHSLVVIETPDGTEVLARQVAGAMARRIVTYAQEGDECFVDEHMGFIKFGSRVDLFLPLGTEVCVKLNQVTHGNETIVARLQAPAAQPADEATDA